MTSNTTDPHRMLRRAGATIAVLGAASAAVALVCLIRLEFPHFARKQPIPHTDVNPYGANFFLDREMEPWKVRTTLEMADAAGIGWIKQQFPWEQIEPIRKGEFDWSRYDRIVDLAAHYDMQVIARLDRPPAWARPGGRPETHPPADLADYGDYVFAVVERYAGRVRYIQIWNEPNLAAEWGHRPADAGAYTELLRVAYRRAKEANPDVVVLSAPLAFNVEDVSMRGNQSDLAFLDQMYQAGARPYFDILSANGFGLGYPPEEPPDPLVLNFRRVELQREIMEEHGDGHKPIWINEYGWNAPPEDFPAELLVWARTTPAQQADYTARGISWARDRWPWLGVVNIWYFRQDGNITPDRAVYYFALVDPEFNPRPVYDRVRAETVGVGVVGAGQHQETSPAVHAPGWRLVLDSRASGGALLAAQDGAGDLTFKFRGRSISLLTMPGPKPGTMVVQIDGRPPDGVPADESGRALVRLVAASEDSRATVALARRLDEGAHVLTLSPVGDGALRVDGFAVSDTNPAFFTIALVLGACLTVGGVVLWVLGARRRVPGDPV